MKCDTQDVKRSYIFCTIAQNEDFRMIELFYIRPFICLLTLFMDKLFYTDAQVAKFELHN